MKNCTFCEKPLEKPIDVYGPEDTPVCQSCFLAGKLEDIVKDEKEKQLVDDIEEMESELRSLEGAVDDLENDIIYYKRKLKEYQRERRERDKNRIEKNEGLPILSP
jgi:uncharacterized protein YlxW (UPF0749 family)